MHAAQRTTAWAACSHTSNDIVDLRKRLEIYWVVVLFDVAVVMLLVQASRGGEARGQQVDYIDV